MNQFELFTMIYYALDYFWDKNGGDELGMFLSDMSPITFMDDCSANPVIYYEFCGFVKDKDINYENSFEIATAYVKWLQIECVESAFAWVDRNDWINKCKKCISEV